MKNEVNRIYWILIATLVLIPTIYFFVRLKDSTFTDSAMGNWFATMVGAVSGIFIALELARWQKISEENIHTSKILTLVRDELKENLIHLNERVADNNPSRFSPYRLKDELWNAFSDGGELEWI